MVNRILTIAMLIIYDPSDPEMVIEIQIHSQGGSPDRQKRGRAFYGEPNVKILDDSSGLCVLSINKQWSLFTLDALVKWGVKDKATPGSLAAA